jgi:hypothetical protein
MPDGGWPENPGQADIDAQLRIGGAVAENVRFEFDLMLMRLLGTEPDLFSAIDRLRSEAEFRVALMPPLLGLAGVLGLRASVWWAALTVIVAVVLARQGATRSRQANDALLEALRVDRAHAPSIDGVDEVIDGVRELRRESTVPPVATPG